MELPLQPGVGSDGEASPTGVARHHAGLSQGRRGRSGSVLGRRPAGEKRVQYVFLDKIFFGLETKFIFG